MRRLPAAVSGLAPSVGGGGGKQQLLSELMLCSPVRGFLLQLKTPFPSSLDGNFSYSFVPISTHPGRLLSLGDSILGEGLPPNLPFT